MEVIEPCMKKQNRSSSNKMKMCNVKCSRKYVQPARVKSFAPEKVYCPPKSQLDANTTYHLSYSTIDSTMPCIRPEPIRPTHSLDKSSGEFCNETTNKLSYRPVWEVVKANPILPRRRSMTGRGIMENVTTTRRDYIPKYMQRPEMILPCKNIAVSSSPFDSSTTTRLSYMPHEPVEPTVNFKPILKYCPPSQPMLKDTTQKLSFQPLCVKEIHRPRKRSTYKAPDKPMCGKTIYSESYLKNEQPQMVKPILPSPANILPSAAEFTEKTIYKESYIGCNADRVEAIIPSGNISLPDDKMTMDTINKLSYRAVQAKRRKPILPRYRNMMGQGPMQSDTTNRRDFGCKITLRPEPIVPCSNIRPSEASMEDKTTTRLSYQTPGPVDPVPSFKPITQYCRAANKMDAETINKLSYQPWTLCPKEKLPWAEKHRYKPPVEMMTTDTIYHMSYPAPGHYVEEECTSECLPPEAAIDCPSAMKELDES
ncbi:hypothetical protein KM043_001051 [Ampulex compressa]|nr:hypothetical protein KM043_001051 [Ampulex compressa]